MIRFETKDSSRPRVGVKPPPGGAAGGCPVRYATRTEQADRAGQ